MNRGLKSYTKQLTQEVGSAKACVNINENDANMHIVFPLIKTVGLMPFEVNLIYTHQNRDVKDGFFGKGFKTDWYSELGCHADDMWLINADGSREEYVDGVFNPETQLTLRQHRDSYGRVDFYYAEDKNGNKKSYGLYLTGYPGSVYNKKGKISVDMTAVDGTLDNHKGDVVTFTRGDNGLVKEVCYKHNETVILTANIVYDSADRIIAVSYKKNNVEIAKTKITYSANTVKLEDGVSGEFAEFTYSGNKITSFKDMYGRTTDIAYAGKRTTVTDFMGFKSYFIFDNNDLLRYEITFDRVQNIFSVTETHYDVKTKQLLSQSSPIISNARNLFTGSMTGFKKVGNNDISISAADRPDDLFSKILNGTVCRVTGTGMLTYDIPTGGIAFENITASIFGRLKKGNATFSILANKNSETRSFVDCGDNFDLLTVGINAEKSFDYIRIILILDNAEIDLGGLRVQKKSHGAICSYDSNGNLTQAAGRGTGEFLYNSNNLPSRSVGADSTLINYEYDSKNNLVKATTAYGVKIENTYDADNNQTVRKMTDTDNRILETQKTYTGDGFVKTEKDELGNITSYEYNTDGNITKITDALGAVTQLSYGGDGLIKELISGTAKAAYQYNAKKMLQKATLANGCEYSFVYDALNRLTEVGLNGIAVFRFLYDETTGQLAEQIYGSGDSFVFDYNSDGNISRVSYRGREGATATERYSYIYNELKQLKKIVDGRGKLIRSFVYDEDGNVESICESDAVVSFNYDSFGNVNSSSVGLDERTVYQSCNGAASSKGAHPEAIVGAFGKNNFIATFAQNDLLVRGNLGFSPVSKADCTMDGIIPCARVTKNNALRYYPDIRPMHSSECDCVMFWFKPEAPRSTFYILYEIPATGQSWIGVESQRGTVTLTVRDAKGNKTELLRSKKQIIDGWNFFALNVYTRNDNGLSGVTEYSITLNGDTQIYKKEGAGFDVNLTPTTMFCVCCDTDNSYYNMEGYIAALCIAPRTYCTLDEIQKYYRLSKDYIIDNPYIDGNVKTVDFGTSAVYTVNEEIQNKFEIAPLHNGVKTLGGKAPEKYDKRVISELDKDRTYNFNKKIKRYAYVADGGLLQYGFGATASGTVMLRAYTDVNKEKQYLFEITDGNGNELGLCRSENNSLQLCVSGKTIPLGLSMSAGEWHTIGLSYKTEAATGYMATGENTVCRIYIDGTQFETVTDKITFADSKITVGRKTEGERGKYNMGESREYYPLRGQIEMLAFNIVYNEQSTLQKLVKELETYTKTNSYDGLGLLRKTEIHKDGVMRLSHTYSYKKRDDTHISQSVETESINYNGVTATRSYGYDGVGRITEISDGVFGSHKYNYDSRGFLTKADNETFAYDKNGNIVNYNGTVIGYDETIKDRITSVGGQRITYECEESINPTTWNGRGYDYEGRQLRRYTYNRKGMNYVYDDRAQRIRKENDEGYSTRYYYNGDKLVIEDGPNGRLEFLYDENGRLYGFVKDEKKYFYIKDITGTILGIADESGAIVGKYEYSAYGKCTITQNVNNIATINPFRFKCYYYDEESGMYYCHTRYFVPEWGRWLNADNPNFLQFDNINGLNLFAYCNNNPVMYSDPSGLVWDTVLDLFFIFWDIYELCANDGYKKWENWLALVVDVTFAVIPFATGGGSQIVKISKATDKISDIKKLTVVGETMNRVQDTAMLVGHLDDLYGGFKAYNNLSSFGKLGKIFAEVGGKAHNAVWLFSKLRKGYTVLDIGIDLSRIGRSSSYFVERTILSIWKYRNAWKILYHFY